MIGPTLLPLSDSLVAGIGREWARLAAPGTWFSGAERVLIADEARIAYAETEPRDEVVTAEVGVAAEMVALSPAHIDAASLDKLERHGLQRHEYAEIVGVVSRVVAVDTLIRGVGGDEVPLPEPLRGEPSRQLETRAKSKNAWLPTVGAARAATVLSSVPPEMYAQEDLHGVLYLAYGDMGELDIVVDGLSRVQMEFVAARASYLNHCVF